MRPVLVISSLLVCCIVCLATALRLEPSQRPVTLPSALQNGSTTTTQIHLFLRSSCRSCRDHEGAMKLALQKFPASIRASMRSRIHLWELGKTDSSEPQRTSLPVPWRSLGIRITPTTWFVSGQDTISQVWLGARSSETWQSTLNSLISTNHRSLP